MVLRFAEGPSVSKVVLRVLRVRRSHVEILRRLSFRMRASSRVIVIRSVQVAYVIDKLFLQYSSKD